jgi:hypothetical protein
MLYRKLAVDGYLCAHLVWLVLGRGWVLEYMLSNIGDQPIHLCGKVDSCMRDEEVMVVSIANMLVTGGGQVSKLGKCQGPGLLSCASRGGASQRHPGGGEGSEERGLL